MNTLENELLQEFGGLNANNLMEIVKDNDGSEEPALLTPSKYYDLDSFETYAQNHRNKFTVLSLNIQSLNAKYEELIVLINHLRDKLNLNFSAICLQEGWFGEDDDMSPFKIPGYKPFSQGRQCCWHGGLITYIHKEFNGKPKSIFKKSEKRLWEAQSIMVSGERLVKKVCISNVYRPPKLNNNNTTVTDFLAEFSPFIEKTK